MLVDSLLNDKLDCFDIASGNALTELVFKGNTLSLKIMVKATAFNSDVMKLTSALDSDFLLLSLDIEYSSINELSLSSYFDFNGVTIDELKNIGRRIIAIKLSSSNDNALINLSYKSFKWHFIERVSSIL